VNDISGARYNKQARPAPQPQVRELVFCPETQRNLRDQQLDTAVSGLSYCLCNERTSGNGDSYVRVGRRVESD
jgi:hypothetical protein